MLPRDYRLSGKRPTPDELRSEFQRDRDRILYSAHFRRLGGITQVTSPNDLQNFHNRLTHTLEVAQLARRMAERAVKLVDGAGQFVDPDVCEAAALAHDLGHPPFGHNGEQSLDALATAAGIPDGYEGNAQSFRILVKLAVRSADLRGLDLTCATLRASTKYPWRRLENPAKPGKFGIYITEEAEFKQVWQGMPPFAPTVEAQIMDWADDVAYSTHDFYDFAVAGVIPISGLKHTDASALKDILSDHLDVANVDPDALNFVARSFQLLPEAPLISESHLTSPMVGILKEWVTALIRRFAAEQIHFEFANDRLVMKRSGLAEQEVSIFKALTYRYAIDSPALSARREAEARILSALFTRYYDSANSREKHLLTADAKHRIENNGESPGRVVLDVLSAMTDAQTLSTEQT